MELTAALRTRIVNTIRMLSADAVEHANSGHPGAPMGQAEMAFVLFDEYLRFDPTEPDWHGRDRFVLSCGHASMLLYSLLNLWGYDVSLEDLKQFRQWGSLTPGHPEVGHTAGVEVTTGPLGQGVAHTVGMAVAAKMMGARLNTDEADGFEAAPQRIFAICSDGDLMEGVSCEAASMAGHWRLDNLVWMYDDNRITIDGDTGLSFSEDVETRFTAMGWRVLRADGHDAVSVRAGLDAAVAESSKPTLIICRTHIGFGSPNKVDTSGVHGSPLGKDELAATRAALGWPETPFTIPDDVAAWFAQARDRKIKGHTEWKARFDTWRQAHPEKAGLYEQLWSGETPKDLAAQLLAVVDGQVNATRKLSAAVLDAALDIVPGLVGGSADLSGSNGIAMKHVGMVGHPEASGGGRFSFEGRRFHFGIREHGMAAVCSGMALHGGFTPFCATFLVFSDYMRPSVRLAALSRTPSVFVYSHDSIFLGEDGPTHQPVEHHWALRIIPDLVYLRPADAVEVAMTWAYAIQEAQGPVSMSLTRQGLPAIERRPDFRPEEVYQGGYVVKDHNVADGEHPDTVLVGTGSELHLCVEAAEELAAEGHKVRVVSMVSWDLFAQQDAEVRHAVVPPSARVCTVEAGITEPWAALTGLDGLRIGLDRFGASAPAKVLAEQFGLTGPQVAERVRKWA